MTEENRTILPTIRRELAAPRQVLVLVLVACLPLYFWALGHPPLFDPDEPVYAATGRAMLHSHSFAGWWSPHYNGQLWFDKPPLTYWLIGLSMSLFGENAFAARFPSALCAIALAAVTARLADSLFPKSRWSGVCAAVVIATCLQSAILARAAVTDMILAVFLTLAVWGLWTWLNDARQVRALLGAGVATGLAVLTKGPVAIVLIGGLALFYLAATHQFIRLLAPALWGALLIALVISLPWYLSMTHLHGALFIQGFLEANNLTRYVSAEHARTSSPLFFVPVLIGFIFPWTGILIAAISQSISDARRGNQSALFALIWIMWVFVFFTLSQTKLVTYIFPLYPLAAVVIGNCIATGLPRWGMAVHVLGYSVLMGFALGYALPLLHGTIRQSFPGIGGVALLLSVLLGMTIVGTVTAYLFTVRYPAWDASRLVYAFPALAMVFLFVTIASARVWDGPMPQVSQTQLAAAIEARTKPGDTVRALTLEKPSLVYYSERNFVFTDSRPETAAAMTHEPYPLCVTKDRYVPDLAANLPKQGRLETVSHSGKEFVLLRYQPPGMTTAR